MIKTLNIVNEKACSALEEAIRMYEHYLQEANLTADEQEETEGQLVELQGFMSQLNMEKYKHSCSFCGKPLEVDTDCYYCADTGETYCYEEIQTEEDIENTCIGRDFINCKYSKETIMFMLGPDDNEYSEAIKEGVSISTLEDENGDCYPEVFVTTVED